MESSIMEEEKMEEENTENQNYPITIQTEEPIQSSIKDKISNVLHHNNFCGICLELSDELLPLTSQLQFPEQEYSMTVGDLLRQVFGNALPAVLFKEHVCTNCLQVILNLYLYIETVKKRARICNYYLQVLDKEINTMGPKLVSKSIKDDNLTECVLILPDPNVPIKEEKETKLFICDCCNKTFWRRPSLTAHLRKMAARRKIEAEKKSVGSNDDSFIGEEQLPTSVAKKKPTNSGAKKKPTNKAKIYKNKVSTGQSKIKKYNLKCVQCHITRCAHEKYLKAYYVQARIKKAGKIQCPECSYSVKTYKTKYSNLMVLIGHANEVHLKRPSDICDKCGKHLYSTRDYKEHLLQKHTDRSRCPYCDKYVMKPRLENHLNSCQTKTREFKCDICPASFEKRLSLQHHVTRHENKEVISCMICNYKTTNQLRLSAHIRKFHDERSEKRVKTRRRTFKCDICNVVQYRYKFRKHIKSHGVSLYCVKCCLYFDTEEEKALHMKTKNHIDKCPYQCDQCDFGTEFNVAFIAHVNLVHKKIAPYVCGECHKCYTTPQRLKVHMLTHTKTYKKHECPHCGTVICSNGGLRRHIMRFHERDKMLKCPHCDGLYVSESARKDHIEKMHIREQTYDCPLYLTKNKYGERIKCTSSFFTVRALRSHLKKSHWNSDEKFDYKKVEGLTEEDLELLRDRRRDIMQEKSDFALFSLMRDEY